MRDFALLLDMAARMRDARAEPSVDGAVVGKDDDEENGRRWRLAMDEKDARLSLLHREAERPTRDKRRRTRDPRNSIYNIENRPKRLDSNGDAKDDENEDQRQGEACESLRESPYGTGSQSVKPRVQRSEPVRDTRNPQCQRIHHRNKFEIELFRSRSNASLVSSTARYPPGFTWSNRH